MTVLSLKNLTMSFGADVLFKNVSFDVGETDKIGLIGINGSGKTTLLNMIANIGDLTADDGEIVKAAGLRIGYMRQHLLSEHAGSNSVYIETLSVFHDLIKQEKELEKLHNILDETKTPGTDLLNRQMEMQESFERDGGLTYKNRTLSALIGLGFTKSDTEKPVDVLSGGEKSKVQLAKLLLSNADLLLLDEPTNHLDIDASAWLEKYLRDYRGAFITISHDRYFLDKITNRTIELENCKLTAYNGNYSAFVQKKEEAREAAEKKYELMTAEIKRIEGIIEQQKRFNQAHNYVTIAHKQKSIDRLTKELEKPEAPPETLKFKFKAKHDTGNDVFKTENLALSLGGRLLFENVVIDIKKGERIFIIGANGTGKTSLLKIFTGEYKADLGSYFFGARVECGYYDQAQTGLDNSKTVINQIWDAFPKMTQTEVRTALGQFLFIGDDVFKKINVLSGGEKARIALLSLMLGGFNLLFLDEPTNHLDIASREALEGALLSYPGTLVVVSHDRYLINKLADRIYELSKNGVKGFDGGYDYYLDRKETEAAFDIKKVIDSEKIISENKNEYKLKKERESEKRRMAGQLSRLEEKIREIENLRKAFENNLNSPETASDYEKITEISIKLSDINAELDLLTEEWAELSERLDNIK